MPDISQSQSIVTTTKVTLNPSLDTIENLIYDYIRREFGALSGLEVVIDIGNNHVTVDIEHRCESDDGDRWTPRHDAIVENLFPR
jgi:hypothetical protein